MINQEVPIEITNDWEKRLHSFEKMIGAKILLCLTKESETDQPIVNFHFQQNEQSIRAQLKQFTAFVLDSGKAQTKECDVDGYSLIVGLPVYWLNKTKFACLIILSNVDALTDDHQLFIESLVSYIEKDLIAIYPSQQKNDQADRVNSSEQYQPPNFQDFINSFEDHLWIKDTNGVYTFCNKAVEDAWLLKLPQIIGRTDEDIFDQELCDKFLSTDRLVIEAGKQVVVEECTDAVNPRNNTWLETIKAPILDELGQNIGVIGMTRNVINRKVIEDQLMIAGTVFENSVEGVIIADRMGNIAYVNKAFCEITGYLEADVIGRNPRFLKSGRHDDSFYQEMWRSLIEESKWQGEIWNRTKDGAIYPQLSTISAVFGENNEICNFVAVFSDISHIKKSEAELTHMAYHDPLTNLPNRLKLTTQIEQEILHVKHHSGRFATIFIDIDHFKHINDSYGHLIGDEVLCEIAKRLKNILRAEDTIARIGGDEFVILLKDVLDIDSVTFVVSQLMKVFETPVALSNAEQLRFTGSMGIALYPNDGRDSDTLLRNADVAMYRAKQDGRNDYAFYTASLTKESEVQLRLQSALHDAIDNDGFHLVYQPQLNMVSGRLIGFETLIRWTHPKLGMISPMEFIPIAEKAGLIHDIGYWVLEKACRQGVQWLKQGYEFGRIAVNVSGQQLQRESFVEQVLSVIHKTGLPTRYLELEVTEGFMMDKPERSIKYLKAFRRFGIEVSIDDFGTGYSSLSYLQKLPLSKIKIDQSFIKNLPHDSNGIAITDAIIAMSNALSLKVIAEGVETKEQADFLKQRGCIQGQGYYFSKPLPADQLKEILESTK